MSGNNKLSEKEKVTQAQSYHRGLNWGWLIGLGGLALIGLVAVLICQVAATSPVGGGTNTSLLNPTASIAAASSSENGKTTPQEVAEYVRQQVAQKLELSIEQLQSKLQSGVPIQTLAVSRKLTVEEWHTFELTSYELGYANLVKAGKMSQMEASYRLAALHDYRQSVLDYLIATDCLGSPPLVQS